MTRETIFTQRIEFGDCDPARIVWFPNFFRWIDAASRHFFTECGVPRWSETQRTMGIIGTPLVDTQAKFLKTASYGDVLQIHTTIVQWRTTSFVQRHRVMRGADLLMTCDEVRIFAAGVDSEPPGIRPVPIPESIRNLCS